MNGTEFDAIAGSELRDTQGEILDVKGADISELEAGRGRINDNHSNKLPDVIGRITKAKKIFGPEDCDDDRQKYYWEKVKAPYIYVAGQLFDADGDHRSARAAAAILKHQHNTDSPLKLKCSVEGGIVKRGEKDSRLLARTKISGLALTFTPANNATLVEGLGLHKAAITQDEKDLINSYIPFAKTKVPNLIEISNNIAIERVSYKVNKINDLLKGLTAGYGGGSPTDATGGGVLQTESIDTSGKGFRYINCQSCGKEQPYMKFQVKCRSCGKSFNFDHLAKFFLNKAKK
jgi:hypothetical protein